MKTNRMYEFAATSQGYATKHRSATALTGGSMLTAAAAGHRPTAMNPLL